MTDLDQSTIDTAGLSDLSGEIGRVRRQRSADEATDKALTGKQAELTDKGVDNLQARSAAAEPISEQIIAKDKERPRARVNEEQIPDYHRPKMDPKEFQNTMGVLTIAAALIGAVSRTPFFGAMEGMKGALEGFTAGDEEMAKRSITEYDKNVAAIKARNDAKRRDVEAAIKDNQNDVAAMKRELELTLGKYDDQQSLQALKQQPITAALKHIQDREKQDDLLMQHLLQTQATLQARVSGGGGSASGNVASVGAMVATGMPIAQAVPGYGKQAVDQRTAARNEAIRQIKEMTGMNDQQAGEELANRQIDYVAGRRSSTQLQTMLGTTRQAVAQLDFNIRKTKEEMAKLGATDISPVLNAIARGEERWTGEPAYSSLFYYLSATGQESARILSGGTASIAQLHAGAAEEARKWVNINMTPASFDSVASAMQEEGSNRIKTFEKALAQQRAGQRYGSPGGRKSSETITTPSGITLIPE